MLTSDDALHMTFTQTKFREGYDQDDVDDFLDRVHRTLREAETGVPAHDGVSTQDVRDVRFRATRMRAGYDLEQVDGFLDQVVTTLDALGSGAPVGRPSGNAAPPPLPPPAAGTPGLVEPRRGWLARLLGG